MPAAAWLVCPDCTAPVRDRALAPRHELRCRQCGQRVKRASGPHLLQTLWALATAGLLLTGLANVEPILTFDVAGNAQSNLIGTGVVGLFAQGFWPVAALVFFGAILGPTLHLAAVWYVAGACCLGRRWPALPLAARFAERLAPWNLVPVYAVAVLVAVVKLDLLGDVEWRQGALWVLLLSLCSLFTAQIFDARAVGQRVARLA